MVLLHDVGFKAAKVMDNMKNANESYVYLHLSEIMFWDLATINAIAKARGLWMSDRHGQAINYPVDPDSTDFVHRTGVLLCEQEVAEIFLNSNLLKTVTRRYPLTKL
ncbi:hypothetical protein GJ496_002094 [Pomphorhynchus laevis]|nr:hypothetical protein GJ496_002094 [Pomphorhynchus laevis]